MGICSPELEARRCGRVCRAEEHAGKKGEKGAGYVRAGAASYDTGGTSSRALDRHVSSVTLETASPLGTENERELVHGA
jgi:hypothetical protein